MSILAQQPDLRRLEEPVEVRNPVRRYRVPAGQTFHRDKTEYRGGAAVLMREAEAELHIADGSLIAAD